jgi:hypothetical protein
MTLFNTEGEIEQAKKPRWLTPSKLPKQPFLATHATGQLKIWSFQEKRKGELQWLGIDQHFIYDYFYISWPIAGY